MRKTNNILCMIGFFIGISLFTSGCLCKSGVESEEWFKYAAKYDLARNELMKNAENNEPTFLTDFSKMSKTKQKFLRAEQPSEETIISVLKSKDKKTQRIGLAAMSLKPIGTEQIIDILIEFLRDDDWYLKNYAYLSLDQVTNFPESKKPQLEKQLLEIIKNEILKGKEGIAFSEFSLLAKVPSRETSLFLTEHLMKEGKENVYNRLGAYTALKEMGEPYYSQAAEYVKNNGSPSIKSEFLDWEAVDKKILDKN